MKHLYFFLIVSFCSSLLSCTNDDSFLAHDFETQQNRALSIYTGNYNIYQIAKKVSLPSASTTKLNSVITNCCNDYPVIKWLTRIKGLYATFSSWHIDPCRFP